jgi:hypothetical protein
MKESSEMPRQATLPPIFAQYAARVEYVQQVSQKEWSSTCPTCGGALHSDRSWPNRCRWFVDEHSTGWCRRCGSLFFPDGAKSAMSREEFERWRHEQVAREEARKRSAETALEYLRSEQIWLRYHEALDAYALARWAGRGIPEGWARFWQLGYRRDWSFRQQDGSLYHTPSLTIPLFDHEWNCINIKHRLLDPPPDRRHMRYLYELKDQEQADPLFLCDPGAPLRGHVIAVEGEIKAAVTFLTLDDPNVAMVGMPGTNPGPRLAEQLADAERITLVMDPGAEEAARKLAAQLGTKRCRILIPPVKVDDGIVAGQLDRRQVQSLLRQAEPVTA